ncbi:MAG TPA: hypothetical protein QF753_22740, partial [Victivallales bacterium]|nr:hypothetical protein [Victivallales bacterium]
SALGGSGGALGGSGGALTCWLAETTPVALRRVLYIQLYIHLYMDMLYVYIISPHSYLRCNVRFKFQCRIEVLM